MGNQVLHFDELAMDDLDDVSNDVRCALEKLNDHALDPEKIEHVRIVLPEAMNSIEKPRD